jgi:integrase
MLTNTKIKVAKPKEKAYKLFDINGLYLDVRPTGKKIWRIRYRQDKKEKTITLGEYPYISLQKAREEAIKVKGRLQNNEAAEIKTFKKVAKEFMRIKKQEWSIKHFKDQTAKLENYILDILGDKDIREITKADINAVLDNIVKKTLSKAKTGDKVELRRKVFLLIKQIFRFAMHKDYVEYNICEAIDINELLPKREEKHIEAITNEEEFKNLVKMLFEVEGVYKITQLALKFLILTALRSGNVRKMEWSWVDLDKDIVIIPASEMKNKKEFRLPLTETLKNILLEAHKIKRSKYVFYSPADPKKPLSENVFIMYLKRLGIKNHKPHGFRTSFSTICYEKQKEHGFSSEVIETQLAHAIGNKVTRAYMRSDFLEERRKLLEWWEGFLNA